MVLLWQMELQGIRQTVTRWWNPIPLSLSYFPVLLCQPLPPALATMLWFGEDFSPLTLDMCGENPLEVSLSLCLRVGNNWFMCILGAQLTAILEGRWQYFGPDLLRLICESYTYHPTLAMCGIPASGIWAWWRPCFFWRSALSQGKVPNPSTQP